MEISPKVRYPVQTDAAMIHLDSYDLLPEIRMAATPVCGSPTLVYDAHMGLEAASAAGLRPFPQRSQACLPSKKGERTAKTALIQGL
jgi:hypothetical protein